MPIFNDEAVRRIGRAVRLVENSSNPAGAGDGGGRRFRHYPVRAWMGPDGNVGLALMPDSFPSAPTTVNVMVFSFPTSDARVFIARSAEQPHDTGSSPFYVITLESGATLVRNEASSLVAQLTSLRPVYNGWAMYVSGSFPTPVDNVPVLSWRSTYGGEIALNHLRVNSAVNPTTIRIKGGPILTPGASVAEKWVWWQSDANTLELRTANDVPSGAAYVNMGTISTNSAGQITVWEPNPMTPAPRGATSAFLAKITSKDSGQVYVGDIYGNGYGSAATIEDVTITVGNVYADETLPTGTPITVVQIGDSYEGNANGVFI